MHKILIVDSFFSPIGGAEKIAYNTFNILKEHNYNVYYWATNKQPYFESLEYANWFTEYVGRKMDYIKNPLRYYYNRKAKKDFSKFILKIQPEIIHFHSLFTLSYSILDSCKNIPSIMTIHDGSIICPAANLMLKGKEYCKNLYCKRRKFGNCIKYKCSNNQLEPSIRHAILSYVKSKSIVNVDNFITPSNALKNVILNSEIGIEKQRIITINNFLTQKEIGDTQPVYTNNGYFLYIGRLSNEKGVHYLLEAMKDLPKGIKLHIVGTGLEEGELKRFAKEYNLDNIEFLGFKTGEDVRNEYQNCIATILPCNWFEIFGMTNIESFINGKPVIASNIGGIPEIVEHNVNGLLFEPANVEQLKECILKYWNNPKLVIEHGKNGYKKAITQYTEERYYNQLIKLYEETISEYKQ